MSTKRRAAPARPGSGSNDDQLCEIERQHSSAGGRRSSHDGAPIEREIVSRHRLLGISAEYVHLPGAGAARDLDDGHDIDTLAFGSDYAPLIRQVARERVDGLAQLLGYNDAIFLRADNFDPFVKGSFGETYLIRCIGCVIDSPDDLRFAPHCPRGKLEKLPAIVGLLRSLDTNRPQSVQRIFLQPDCNDRLRDRTRKMTCGPAASAAFRDGAS